MSIATTSALVTTAAVNFSGAWSTFWSKISQPISKLLTLLTIIGVLLVVGALISYVFEKRRSGGGFNGGGAGNSKIGWALAAGIILAAPNALIPLLLKIIDGVANAFLNILS